MRVQMPVPLLRRAAAAALAVSLLGLVPATAEAAHRTSKDRVVAATPAKAAPSASRSDAWEPRPEKYPGTVKRTDLKIPMSDGVVLRGDLTLPADASGQVVDKRFPVIVTITAYNKNAVSFGSEYLVKRGYAQLTVDARGTGSSRGTWGAFSQRENRDAGEIIEWAHSRKRPWSNGRIGMSGPSYMGISQLFAAEHRPAGLKAIFPQVPAADVYRDVVASGGAIDVGFIPLWMGLVTSTGLIPPAYGAEDPQEAFAMFLDRLLTGGTFTAPLILEAMAGQDPAYDGPFYRERSPIVDIARVDVPTFLVGGEYDLFQRGTPLVFEALQQRGVPVKMIFGPWDHLEGSQGQGIGDAGYGTLDELQLRWFDRYVRGVEDPTLDRDIPPMTYYEQGSGTWRTAKTWLGRRHQAITFNLSGAATTGATPGVLRRGTPERGSSDVLPIPVQGACTRSASQWTAGIPNTVFPQNPCLTNNSWNDQLGLVFETQPLKRAVAFQGPLNARLRVSTDTGEGMLAIAISDVAPDGTVSRLTGGWQVISHRALDRSRSRYLDGRLIQPWHPFTKAAQKPLGPGEVAPVDVEIFPTGAKIRPGHRLRISVQAFDVPHLLPPLPTFPGTLSRMTVHTGPKAPSLLTLPGLRR